MLRQILFFGIGIGLAVLINPALLAFGAAAHSRAAIRGAVILGTWILLNLFLEPKRP